MFHGALIVSSRGPSNNVHPVQSHVIHSTWCTQATWPCLMHAGWCVHFMRTTIPVTGIHAREAPLAIEFLGRVNSTHVHLVFVGHLIR